jgi:hypothetical protein
MLVLTPSHQQISAPGAAGLEPWGLDRLAQTPGESNSSSCHDLVGRLEMLRMAAPHVVVNLSRATTIDASECLASTEEGAIVWSCEDGMMAPPESWTGLLAPVTALALEQTDVRGAFQLSSWLRRLVGACP